MKRYQQTIFTALFFLSVSCVPFADAHNTALAQFVAETNAATTDKQSDSKDKTETGSTTDTKAQVQAWFAKYDQIRRDAEMTMQEKLQAHALFTRGLESEAASSQSEKSTSFATTMQGRYTDAASKLKALPELTAVAELQKDYVSFFGRASSLFQEFLTLQKSDGDKKEKKAKLLSSKESMTAEDKKIKLLDARIRSQFGVKAHRHK